MKIRFHEIEYALRTNYKGVVDELSLSPSVFNGQSDIISHYIIGIKDINIVGGYKRAGCGRDWIGEG